MKQYAKHRDVEYRMVQKYISSGFIPSAAIVKEGRNVFILVDVADKALEKNVMAQGGTEKMSYSQARTERERYKAALAKLEWEEKSKILINADEVRNAAFNTGRMVRDALLNIPDRISAIVAAETDEPKVREILRTEITQALEALTKKII